MAALLGTRFALFASHPKFFSVSKSMQSMRRVGASHCSVQQEAFEDHNTVDVDHVIKYQSVNHLKPCFMYYT